MGRMVAVLAAVALVGMLVFVGMTIDLALHGAYVSGGVESFPGAETVAGVGSAIALLGLLALLAGTILGLVLTLRGREWVWLVVIFTLFPVAVVSLLSAGFVANISVALLTLPAPVALVIYGALARRARVGGRSATWQSLRATAGRIIGQRSASLQRLK